MLTLEMIEVIETKYGSLYQLAEDLINNSLPDKIIKDILKLTGYYCSDMPSAENLKNILLDTLEPIEDMGAALLGEEFPA